MTLYKSIMLDPPWMERGGGKIKRGADRHYPLVKTADLTGLINESGKFTPDRTGCSIWMWATANFLGDALRLMNKLGADYVTNVVWVKDGPPGLGQRFRMMHEHLLYGRIGRVPVPEPANRIPSVIIAPRTKHSEKPLESYRMVERHDPPGPRLEMFARRGIPGWDSWGNQAPALMTESAGEGAREDADDDAELAG